MPAALGCVPGAARPGRVGVRTAHVVLALARRCVARRAVVGAGLVLVAAIYLNSRQGAGCSGNEARGAFGALTCTTRGIFAWGLPLLGFGVGGALTAVGRGRGEDALYAVRGLRGVRLALVRSLAGSVAAGLVGALVGCALVVLNLLTLPWRDHALIRPSAFRAAVEMGYDPRTVIPPYEMGFPTPGLWSLSPLLCDLVTVVLGAVACAAVAALGCAIGQAVARPIVPTLLVFTLSMWPMLNPFRSDVPWATWFSFQPYLEVAPVHSKIVATLAAPWRAVVPFGFFVLLLLVSVVAVCVVAWRQEARA